MQCVNPTKLAERSASPRSVSVDISGPNLFSPGKQSFQPRRDTGAELPKGLLHLAENTLSTWTWREDILAWPDKSLHALLSH